MTAVARIAYRAILRLHPSAFRSEFGDEMLWIFDEELRKAHSALPFRLLLDGIRSAVVQHTVRPHAQALPEPEAIGPKFCQIESAIPLVRFAQAGFVGFACLFCVLSVSVFASMVVPKFVASQKSWFVTPVKVFYTVPNAKLQRSTYEFSRRGR